MNQGYIRNFAIIAHIDHGKSTLADRLLEITGTVQKRDMRSQLLDSNPIERERGITIKLAPVRMIYHAKFSSTNSQFSNNFQTNKFSNDLKIENWKLKNEDSKKYVLNLIDTPGHVDFGYEVSRSLAACEGALLVVDATQGVQAQTLAHLHQARIHNLTIIPLINKIDMPHARIRDTRNELRDLGFADDEMIEISAKTGQNVEIVLDTIIDRVPPPNGAPTGALRALIFSSQFDTHKGVVVFVRVVDGTIYYDDEWVTRAGGPPSAAVPTVGGRGGKPAAGPIQLRFFASNALVTPVEVGFFMPQMVKSDGLGTGEVGYIATGLKDVRLAKVGDTITTMPNAKFQMPNEKQKFSIQHSSFSITPLAGYREPKPMVFLSLFPINSDEFSSARELLEKLRLSDSAFTFRPISSVALGNGFHCGFLGLLHAEIVQERLSREFDLNMIATAPSVEYHLMLKPGVSLSKLGLTASSVIQKNTRVTQAEGLPSGTRSPAATMNVEENDAGTSANEKIGKDTGSVSGEDARREKPVAGPGTEVVIQSAAEFPDPTYIDGVKEPIMQVQIFTPKKYVGAIMQLAAEKRGEYIDMTYIQPSKVVNETSGRAPDLPLSSEERVMVEMTYLIPLSDMIIDFFDRLKSISEGYASLDYEFFEFQSVDVVKVDILVNHEKVDALSFLAVRDQAHHRSIAIVERLAAVIPRQQFEIPIQGAIGGAIDARKGVQAVRQHADQKLYGGVCTRNDKLLPQTAKGKERMKSVGRVQIPQTAFFEVLKRE